MPADIGSFVTLAVLCLIMSSMVEVIPNITSDVETVE